jgi:Ca2+-binding EF-hand superfamily protein
MNIIKLSEEMDSFAQDTLDNLKKIYESFDDDGSLKENKDEVENVFKDKNEEEKAQLALDMMKEICDALDETKFKSVCGKLEEAIHDIKSVSEESLVLEVNDDEDLEESVQKDIEKEEEKFEYPRARWEHE